jgi:hypothetical protein
MVHPYPTSSTIREAGCGPVAECYQMPVGAPSTGCHSLNAVMALGLQGCRHI